MKIIIIGSGQTGRGYIAPLIRRADQTAELYFVDKNASLIDELNKEKKYEVSYFGEKHSVEVVSNYKAIHITDSNLTDTIADADVVVTSVFANNLNELIPYLKMASEKRVKNGDLFIICAENGVNVKKPLVEARIKGNISEAVIFCTSVSEKGSINIKSEYINELPIDGEEVPIGFEFEPFKKIDEFGKLIKQKIYTYNFLSAAISYLGDYLHYSDLYNASQDEHIKEYLEITLPLLNTIISKSLEIETEKQKGFSQKALEKFSNKDIYDSISRNAQQVSRKLGKNERIVYQINQALNFGIDYIPFAFLAAVSIKFGEKYESLDYEEIENELKESIEDNSVIQNIRLIHSELSNNTLLSVLNHWISK